MNGSKKICYVKDIGLHGAEMSERNRKKGTTLAAIFLSFVFILAGCSSESTDNRSNLISTENAKLIYEETVSPNKAYVASDEDVVYYHIEIYQDKNYTITVNASANSSLFEDQSYTLDYDKQIAEEDVAVRWTTLMGNPEASKSDQLAIAQVSISNNGVVWSERKINFAKNAIDIIVDIISQNK